MRSVFGKDRHWSCEKRDSILDGATGGDEAASLPISPSDYRAPRRQRQQTIVHRQGAGGMIWVEVASVGRSIVMVVRGIKPIKSVNLLDNEYTGVSDVVKSAGESFLSHCDM